MHCLRNYTVRILDNNNRADSLIDGDESIVNKSIEIFTALKNCIYRNSIEPIVDWFDNNPIDLNNIRIYLTDEDRNHMRNLQSVCICNFMEICYIYVITRCSRFSQYESVYDNREILSLMKKIVLEAVKYGLDIKYTTPNSRLKSGSCGDLKIDNASTVYALFCMGDIMKNVGTSPTDKDIYTSHLLQYTPSDTLNFIKNLENNVTIARPLLLSYMRHNNIIERYITNIVSDQYNSIYISNIDWNFPSISISSSYKSIADTKHLYYLLTADPYCTKGLLRAGLNTRKFMQTLVDDDSNYSSMPSSSLGPCPAPFSISSYTTARDAKVLWFNTDANNEHLFRRNNISELCDNPISIIDWICNVTDYLVMYGVNFNKMVGVTTYIDTRGKNIMPAFQLIMTTKSSHYIWYIIALRLYTKYINLLNTSCGYTINNVIASNDYDIDIDYTPMTIDVYIESRCGRFTIDNVNKYTENHPFFRCIKKFMLDESESFTSKYHYAVFYNRLTIGEKRKYTNAIRKLLKEAYANILNVIEND